MGLTLSLLQARPPTPGVPLVAFTMKAHKRTHGYNEFDVADRLRQFGWVVPVRVPMLCFNNTLQNTGSGLHASLVDICDEVLAHSAQELFFRHLVPALHLSQHHPCEELLVFVLVSAVQLSRL